MMQCERDVVLTVECVKNYCQNEAMTALKFVRRHDDVDTNIAAVELR